MSDPRQPHVSELLEQPGAVLNSSHLAQLGHSRRAVEAIQRACPVVLLPGYRRPLVKVEDYKALLERRTFTNDQVHPDD